MKYFLIAGNTRVGSTWLQVCLHQIPDVYCTREVRWNMPYFNEAPPVHHYVDKTTTSMKERLDVSLKATRRKNISAVGAKLKFDPNGFVPPEYFDNLKAIIENDVTLIMLRRSYFDIFATLKSYGIRHLANPDTIKNVLSSHSSKERSSQTQTSRFHQHHGVPLEENKIHLTNKGNQYLRGVNYINSLKRTPDQETKFLHYPLEEAIQDLFVLFFNDVYILSLLENLDEKLIINYSDIESNFPKIAHIFAPELSQSDCEKVLANAATRKIEQEGIQLVFPDNALKALSDYLDGLFNKIQAGELRAGDIVRYDEQKNKMLFHTPGLDDIFQRYDETNRISLDSRKFSRLFQFINSRKNTEFWTSTKKVYHPTA